MAYIINCLHPPFLVSTYCSSLRLCSHFGEPCVGPSKISRAPPRMTQSKPRNEGLYYWCAAFSCAAPFPYAVYLPDPRPAKVLPATGPPMDPYTIL